MPYTFPKESNNIIFFATGFRDAPRKLLKLIVRGIDDGCRWNRGKLKRQELKQRKSIDGPGNVD